MPILNKIEMRKLILTTLFLTSLILSNICEGKNPNNNLEENIWLITFYCPCEICCEEYSDGITASGFPVCVDINIAANNFLPFGTVVQIQDVGRYIILDRGSKEYFCESYEKIKHIDVLVYSHDETVRRGIQFKNVEVIR